MNKKDPAVHLRQHSCTEAANYHIKRKKDDQSMIPHTHTQTHFGENRFNRTEGGQDFTNSSSKLSKQHTKTHTHTHTYTFFFLPNCIWSISGGSRRLIGKMEPHSSALIMDPTAEVQWKGLPHAFDLFVRSSVYLCVWMCVSVCMCECLRVCV